jgi:hypothetical protein
MTDSLGTIGDKPLAQLVLPGSHDAGMSLMNHGVPPGVPECGVITQAKRIAQQLREGCRYFDERPTWWSHFPEGRLVRELYTGHGERLLGHLPWTGGVGEVLADVLNDVKAFATEHPSEIVILCFSHYATVWNSTGFSFDQKLGLRTMVLDILGEQMYRNPVPDVNINTLTPNEILRDKRNVICVFDDFSQLYNPRIGILAGAEWPALTDIPLSTSEAPSLVVGPQNVLHCFYANNADKLLYYTTSFDGGATWSDGYNVGGWPLSLDNGPASAVGDDRVYLAFASGFAIYVGRGDLIGDERITWGAPQALSEETDAPPTIAVDPSGIVYVVFRQRGGRQLLLCTSADRGRTWSKNVPLGLEASGAPSLTVDDTGILYLAYTSAESTGIVRSAWSCNGGATWCARDTVETTQGSPALAIDASHNQLTLVFPAFGSENLLYCVSSDSGATWTRSYDVGNTTNRPARIVAGPDGTIRAVFANPIDRTISYKTFTRGHIWGPVMPIAEATEQKPAVVATDDGALHALFTKANDGGIRKILYSRSADNGHSWTRAVPIGYETTTSPAVTVGKDGMTLHIVFSRVGPKIAQEVVCVSGKPPNWGAACSVQGQQSWITPAVTLAGSARDALLHVVFVSANDKMQLLHCTSPDGITWTRGNDVPEATAMAPALASSPDGRYLYLMFTKRGGTVVLFTRYDTQKNTWDRKPFSSDTDAPTSLAVGNGGTLYAFNANPIRVWQSIDQGETWSAPVEIGKSVRVGSCVLSSGDPLVLFTQDGTTNLAACAKIDAPVPGSAKNNYPRFDVYADSNDIQTVIGDQKTKLSTFKPDGSTSFVLSWTGTWQWYNPLTCVSELANELNTDLPEEMIQWVNDGTITPAAPNKLARLPNIVYVDFYDEDKYRVLEAVNYLNALPTA